jgi:hypothetical protein
MYLRDAHRARDDQEVFFEPEQPLLQPFVCKRQRVENVIESQCDEGLAVAATFTLWKSRLRELLSFSPKSHYQQYQLRYHRQLLVVWKT